MGIKVVPYGVLTAESDKFIPLFINTALNSPLNSVPWSVLNVLNFKFGHLIKHSTNSIAVASAVLSSKNAWWITSLSQ